MNELTYFIAKRTSALLSTIFNTDCQQRAAEVKNTCSCVSPPNYNLSALHVMLTLIACKEQRREKHSVGGPDKSTIVSKIVDCVQNSCFCGASKSKPSQLPF